VGAPHDVVILVLVCCLFLFGEAVEVFGFLFRPAFCSHARARIVCFSLPVFVMCFLTCVLFRELGFLLQHRFFLHTRTLPPRILHAHAHAHASTPARTEKRRFNR
jgi:hypothetical protein